jgi:hypothetical protein
VTLPQEAKKVRGTRGRCDDAARRRRQLLAWPLLHPDAGQVARKRNKSVKTTRNKNHEQDLLRGDADVRAGGRAEGQTIIGA